MLRSRDLGRALPALAVAAVLAGPGAAAAGAVTFGADLSAPADDNATCSALGTSSCTFFSTAPGPTFYAPASGTVTTVRVRTGDFAQGPMQVIVMRSLYQNHAGDPGHPYYACCYVQRYGPTFTPARNAVTTVAASLPMHEDPTPAPDDYSTVAADDFLALSVLSGDVPLPANLDNQSGYLVFAPAPTPDTTPAPSESPQPGANDGIGIHLLLNADLDTGGGAAPGGGTPGGGGGTTGPTGPTAPAGQPGTTAPAGGGTTPAPVAIRPGATLRGSTATIPLLCALSTRCRGTVQLLAQRPGGKRRARTIVVGSHAFTLRAHRSGRVRVALNAAGRRLAARRRSLAVTVRVTIGRRVTSRRLTVRRP